MIVTDHVMSYVTWRGARIGASICMRGRVCRGRYVRVIYHPAHSQVVYLLSHCIPSETLGFSRTGPEIYCNVETEGEGAEVMGR